MRALFVIILLVISLLPANEASGRPWEVLGAGIGLQRRCPEGESRKITPTHHEREANREISVQISGYLASANGNT
jgi:hypothetical protein